MVAAAVVGSAVVGAAASSSAASKGAKAQNKATDSANALQWDMYEQNREDAAPWREAGTTALGQLTTGTANGGEFNRNFTMQDFQQDPGYAFRQQEGLDALQSSASARGGVLGGAALKGITRFGQDFASNEYANAYNRFNNDTTSRFNRLSSIAGLGQTAQNQTANQGMQTAYNVGQNTIGAGNANAASSVANGNAISGAASTLGNFALQRSFMSSYAPAASSGFGTGAAYGNQDYGSYL